MGREAAENVTHVPYGLSSTMIEEWSTEPVGDEFHSILGLKAEEGLQQSENGMETTVFATQYVSL